MSKKNREQLRESFLFAVPSTQGDLSFIEIVQANNLSKLATRIGYISAAVSGGKMSPKDAEAHIKDLYKVWKESNKSLQSSWK